MDFRRELLTLYSFHLLALEEDIQNDFCFDEFIRILLFSMCTMSNSQGGIMMGNDCGWGMGFCPGWIFIIITVIVLCIQRTLSRGRVVGLVSGLGAVTVDAFYGGVAGLGLTMISARCFANRIPLMIARRSVCFFHCLFIF
jgi:hypothetical protein